MGVWGIESTFAYDEMIESHRCIRHMQLVSVTYHSGSVLTTVVSLHPSSLTILH
jgi:hypothetical protein